MGNKVDQTQNALYYAIKLGMAVIPVPPGKKGPIIENWPQVATTDPAKVRQWWHDNPDYNIGFVTGPKSGGIFVIDLDVDDDTGADGIGVLREWEEKNGALPETWRDISGRGGSHLYFHSDQVIENDDRTLHDDIEVRGHGLNVILPPSLHSSGRRYQWEAGCAPWEIPIAEANDIVMKFVTHEQQKKERLHLPQRIDEGCREWTLFRAACSMQGTGFCDEAIDVAIKTQNNLTCDPVLPEKEVDQLLNSALKHEKGDVFDSWEEAGEIMYQQTLRRLLRKIDSGT